MTTLQKALILDVQRTGIPKEVYDEVEEYWADNEGHNGGQFVALDKWNLNEFKVTRKYIKETCAHDADATLYVTYSW